VDDAVELDRALAERERPDVVHLHSVDLRQLPGAA
jgi:hypothetical protein